MSLYNLWICCRLSICCWLVVPHVVHKSMGVWHFSLHIYPRTFPLDFPFPSCFCGHPPALSCYTLIECCVAAMMQNSKVSLKFSQVARQSEGSIIRRSDSPKVTYPSRTSDRWKLALISSLSYPEQTLNGRVVNCYCYCLVEYIYRYYKAWVSGRTIGPSDYRTFGLSIQNRCFCLYNNSNNPQNYTASTFNANILLTDHDHLCHY